MYRHARITIVLLLATWLLPSLAAATPTGLNNIPTADVVDEGVLVLQSFSHFGDDRTPSWFAGLKVGPAARWEIGLDDTFAGPGAETGPALQLKRRFELGGEARLGLGAANITNDADRNGDIFPYAVVSAPLGEKGNGHLGYSVQEDNHALFLGADAAVSPRLTLRADWIQTNDGDESVSSLGFISPITDRFLVEGWASFPTADGAESDYIVKLDFVIPRGRG